MKEVNFIRESEERWKNYEKLLQKDGMVSPDELSEMYVQITDDLSYAKTFYPKGKLVLYLENIAARTHRSIYSNSKEDSNRIAHFFKYEVPLAVRRSHKELLFALCMFLIAIAIGMFSSYHDSDYCRLILGDAYVNITLENIENEDPMAIYKSSDSANMFFQIGSNNIRVSFLAFIAGIMGSLGTIAILFTNGLMVGAFVYFFIEKGIGALATTTIMIHGTLELAAIVIAGGAGIVLGNSMLFPGTYKRGISLIHGARKSIKIIIGLVPVFVAAAILESYVTRWYLEIGMGVRLAIIGVSLVYLIWYFVLYPLKKFPNG